MRNARGFYVRSQATLTEGLFQRSLFSNEGAALSPLAAFPIRQKAHIANLIGTLLLLILSSCCQLRIL